MLDPRLRENKSPPPRGQGFSTVRNLASLKTLARLSAYDAMFFPSLRALRSRARQCAGHGVYFMGESPCTGWQTEVLAKRKGTNREVGLKEARSKVAS